MEGVGVAPGEMWEIEAWVVVIAAGPTALMTLDPTGLRTELPNLRSMQNTHKK